MQRKVFSTFHTPRFNTKMWIMGGGVSIYIYMYMYMFSLETQTERERERETEREREREIYIYIHERRCMAQGLGSRFRLIQGLYRVWGHHHPKL